MYGEEFLAPIVVEMVTNAHYGTIGHNKKWCYKLPSNSNKKKVKKGKVDRQTSTNQVIFVVSIDKKNLELNVDDYDKVVTLFNELSTSLAPSVTQELKSLLNWIIVLGVSDHVIGNFDCLSSPNLCKHESRVVNLSNGHTINVTHIGLVYLPNDLILRTILYRLAFNANLIFIPKYCKHRHKNYRGGSTLTPTSIFFFLQPNQLKSTLFID